jgi:hypothetical protein
LKEKKKNQKHAGQRVWRAAAGRERKNKNKASRPAGKLEINHFCHAELKNSVVPTWHDRNFWRANVARMKILAW